MNDDTREELAAYAHEAWSGWMEYLFSKCDIAQSGPAFEADAPDGRLIIPAWAVERWTRQMNTPYADLPESEKESDRKEADRMLAIMFAAAGGEKL